MNRVAVVVVNWNSVDLLIRLLKSINKYNPELKGFVYVVDNASSESVDKIYKKFNWVNLIVNNKNVGFGAACNQILKKIKSEFVLVLNPDIQILPGSIRDLLEAMDSDQEMMIGGSLLLNEDMSIQRKGYYRKFPSLIQVILFYTQLAGISKKNDWLVKKFWEETPKKNENLPVDQVPGACMFLRRESFGNKFFDERFWLWFEDVDLCYRVKKLNKTVKVIGSSQMIHTAGVMFQKWSDLVARELQMWTSMIIFFNKNYSKTEAHIVRFVISLDLVVFILIRIIAQVFGYKTKRQELIKVKINILKGVLKL